ncbi:hypothetical protein XENOCAPTIV_001310 [Xenoophorus captivus]|uniref:C2H2-type domain-containing protein n=1 Tax=Xenoophorus captivus TaxID=1517983 RepID=A0ABV0RN08_9TELE
MDAYETHLHQHALEEEESQMRDNRAPIGHMDTEEENGQEDGRVGVDGCDMNRSAQKQPPELTQGVHVIDSNLRNYECPDCGMLFIRRTRLISHLRVHRSKRRNKLPKCDQCNKVFTSVKSWTAHVELHKERRFWCLSCAQGFMNEGMLDKHLQSHSLRQQNHNADESIHNAKPFLCPPKIQRTHHCLHCGKRFWRSKTLFRHKLKHLGCQGGATSKPPGSPAFNQGVEDMETETSLTNRREKLEMDASMEELQAKEENMKIRDQSQHSAAEDGDQENFEDSDCGEPGHCYEISELHRSDNQLDQPSSEAVHSPAGKERERAEPRLHREHKYWEWECIECDMGFDEMAKLHSHYVKHATGELPIPKEEIEV